MPANWKLHGKMAGPIRNQDMLDRNPDIELVVAFGGDAGTSDMVSRSIAAGLSVIRVHNEELQ